MKNARKLFLYIILNIVVTVSVFFIMVNWWENKYLNDIPPTPQSNSVAQTTPTATLSPFILDLPSGAEVEDMLEIVMVVGAGDLNNEHVQIKNTGAETVSLLGWTLTTKNNQSYQFPAIKLYPNSEIRLYTKIGTNTVYQLYKGSQEAQWHPQDTLTLADPAGIPQATYLIP